MTVASPGLGIRRLPISSSTGSAPRFAYQRCSLIQGRSHSSGSANPGSAGGKVIAQTRHGARGCLLYTSRCV